MVSEKPQTFLHEMADLMKDIGVALLVAIAIAVYFLPTIIAIRRHYAYKGIIAVINLVFGLSGIGWAGA